MSKQATAVIATIVVSGLLFTSLAAMQADGHDVAFGSASAPTPHSADHSRVQAGSKDEERAPTF
jgi:hypothetical protein